MLPAQCEHYLQAGGLPEICFNRNARYRGELFDSHLDTLLSRDLPTNYPSKLSLERLRELLAELATQQGQFLNLSQIARKLGTTSPTVSAHLRAFQNLFLIREHGPVYFFENQGTASHLRRFERKAELTVLHRLIFTELQSQKHYALQLDLLSCTG